ncbi:hypothetical protein BU16DRAFT_543437 [Lophium mytilinum]|uniref:Uncharacterized protein n=1 Tax=Lophium mytilinum TaxID=390894 RepID=A0A6A6QFY9_9PEZI|nr:hypothetical protein BU16DRAFT_543437 [Lophium mytilinum]
MSDGRAPSRSIYPDLPEAELRALAGHMARGSSRGDVLEDTAVEVDLFRAMRANEPLAPSRVALVLAAPPAPTRPAPARPVPPMPTRPAPAPPAPPMPTRPAPAPPLPRAPTSPPSAPERAPRRRLRSPPPPARYALPQTLSSTEQPLTLRQLFLSNPPGARPAGRHPGAHLLGKVTAPPDTAHGPPTSPPPTAPSRSSSWPALQSRGVRVRVAFVPEGGTLSGAGAGYKSGWGWWEVGKLVAEWLITFEVAQLTTRERHTMSRPSRPILDYLEKSLGTSRRRWLEWPSSVIRETVDVRFGTSDIEQPRKRAWKHGDDNGRGGSAGEWRKWAMSGLVPRILDRIRKKLRTTVMTVAGVAQL